MTAEVTETQGHRTEVAVSSASGLVRAGWLAASGVSIAVVTGAMYWMNSAAFHFGDKRNQYLPVAMDIGRRLRAGEWLPVIDPNLGISGNYSLDIQYGLFDPSHWPVAIGLSYFTNLALAGFVWALLFEIVVTLGVTALGGRLGMPMPWAAAAGLGVACSGWLLFTLATDWIPGLESMAWLPWLWWAWLGRGDRLRARDCVGVAAFGYLVVAGGWPSTWTALGALVVGLAVESWVRRDLSARASAWLGPLVLRGLALLAGLACAALCVLPLYHAAPFTARKLGFNNNNFLTGNLADMLAFSAPQLHGDIISFGGAVTLGAPVFFAGWFGVVVLWTQRWNRGLWRRPGLVTSVLGCVGMLLLTQAPSQSGPLRDQIRQLGGAQFFFVLGVCVLATSAPWLVTRVRVLGVVFTVATMGWLSWSRDPLMDHALVGIAVVAVAAVVLLVVASKLDALTGVAALMMTIALTVVAVGLNTAKPDPSAAPTSHLSAGTLALTAADEPIYALYPKGIPAEYAMWQVDGVGRAFSDLRAVGRVAPGYSSVSQRGFRALMCSQGSQGQSCPAGASRLFRTEPTTGQTWADLLGYRTIVVAGATRQASFVKAAGPDWHLVQTASSFAEYQRSGPIDIAGRVTHVVGQASVSAIALSNDSQSYRVRSPQGAQLIFRDLFWPGYVATLNGKRIPVKPLDGTLVTVTLSHGATGVLTIRYVPLSTKTLIAVPLGSILLLAAVCGWLGYRRRREPDDDSAADDVSPAVDGDQETAEPEHSESLKHPV